MCSSQFDNKRYFKYKLELCSQNCTIADAAGPEVQDIAVIWTP